MNRRITYTVFLLLLVESGLAYYVFNHTARERTPTTIYVSEEAVTCFAISNWGDALAWGTAEGDVAYYQKGKSTPQWVYQGGSPVSSVLVSSEGDFVLVMDLNHTASLFRSLGDNTPRWSQRLEDGRILGIHASGGIPPTVYMLASVGTDIFLLSDREGLLWMYSAGAAIVSAEISYDGKHLVAVDAEGTVYFFDILDSNPVWVSHSGVIDGVISLSQSSQVAVGGVDSLGGGRALSLSLVGGELLWDWRAASPVEKLSMSSDGSKTVVFDGSGEATVLTVNADGMDSKGLAVTVKAQSVWSPPFGSYAVVLGSDGRVYFFYTPRSAPLWVYDAGLDVVDVAVTSTGDKVFVADRGGVAVIDNSIGTGMIPGSRVLWGGWFLMGFMGLAVVYRVAGVEPELMRQVNEGYSLLASGLVVGGVIGFIVWGGALEVFAAAMGCSVGCFFGFKKDGLGGFMTKLFALAAASLAASMLYGLSVWFSGAERNVVVLVVTSVSGGTWIGFVSGVLGVSLGFMLTKLWDPPKATVST